MYDPRWAIMMQVGQAFCCSHNNIQSCIPIKLLRSFCSRDYGILLFQGFISMYQICICVVKYFKNFYQEKYICIPNTEPDQCLVYLFDGDHDVHLNTYVQQPRMVSLGCLTHLWLTLSSIFIWICITSKAPLSFCWTVLSVEFLQTVSFISTVSLSFI